MWMLYSKITAIVLNFILLIFLLAFIINAIDIVQKFFVNEDEAVSGKFTDFSKFHDVKDLDSYEQYSRGG